MRAEIEARPVWAPGRVNLIGELIDFHNLAVLPMALRQGIRVKYRPRADHLIRVSSAGFGAREFEWTSELDRVAAGDWENYLRAAAQAVAGRWGVGPGVNAEIESDLPPAAGLSSSSALIVAFTLCLLGARGLEAGFEELMEVLPEGEHFVGTRGGGMDHAASLASRAGFASLVSFQPAAVCSKIGRFWWRIPWKKPKNPGLCAKLITGYAAPVKPRWPRKAPISRPRSRALTITPPANRRAYRMRSRPCGRATLCASGTCLTPRTRACATGCM
jgi:hypothetical protein